ncbi:hypothetical protein JXB41_05845 [Candidatus Woesearchaeota archaeon]|nr:hypothetical protein [Candidatus Woesearchaeota archaeon]
MQKRGLSQLDWAMSLAIFILFIAWFFIFIRPNLDLGVTKQSLFMLVKNNFFHDYEWQIEKMPLFISTEDLNNYKPVIVNFSFEWNNFKFKGDDYFIREDNYLIFLPNIPASPRVFWLIHGGNYTTETGVYGLVATPNWTTTSKNIRVDFEESFLSEIYYDDSKRLHDFKAYINLEEFKADDYSYSDNGILSRYFSNTPGFNHTFNVYAQNSRTDSFVRVNNPVENYTYTIRFRLWNYSNYYSNNVFYDDIDYSEDPEEVSYVYDYITFYDDESAVSIFFDRNTSINFISYNESLEFNCSFLLYDNAQYEIIFHRGSYLNISRQDYSYMYGLKEIITGLNKDLLSTAEYEELKQRWNYPFEKNFKIRVYNSTSARSHLEVNPLFEIGLNDPETKVTYAEDINTYILDEDSELTPATVNIVVW